MKVAEVRGACGGLFANLEAQLKHAARGCPTCNAALAQSRQNEGPSLFDCQIMVRGDGVVRLLGTMPPAASAEVILDEMDRAWVEARAQVVLALKAKALPQDWLRD